MMTLTIADSRRDLRNFYFLRAGIAFAWVAVVLLTHPSSMLLAGTLLVFYPAWDALANLLDARRSGGLAANPGQRLNALVSLVTALSMALAFALHGNAGGMLVFGAWALLAGLFQLAVGVRRRRTGGQAFMMISGAQSAVAGILFIVQATGEAPGITRIAPYAAFGGLYFLLSALWLAFRKPKRPVQPAA